MGHDELSGTVVICKCLENIHHRFNIGLNSEISVEILDVNVLSRR
jgi:hypothetical protein